MTAELLALADWLAAHGVAHVAMESTGVYWKPVYNLLEARFEVMLVNAQHIKQVPGRKTDVKDCQWIAQLLQHGLLAPSFVPPPADPRAARPDAAAQPIGPATARRRANRIQKVLEDANIKLASVATRRPGRLGPGDARGLDRRARRPGGAGRAGAAAAAGQDPAAAAGAAGPGHRTTTASCSGAAGSGRRTWTA